MYEHNDYIRVSQEGCYNWYQETIEIRQKLSIITDKSSSRGCAQYNKKITSPPNSSAYEGTKIREKK